MTKPILRVEDLPDFLTTLETALLLRISKRTLDAMRHHGNGPKYLKLGGRIVYQRVDILRWANDNERRSTQYK